MILLILSVIVGIPTIIILLIVLCYTVAQDKKQASFVQQETIEFVVAGTSKTKDDKADVGKVASQDGTLVKTLVNTKGYRFYDRPEPIDYPVTIGKPKKDTGISKGEQKQLRERIRKLEQELIGSVEQSNSLALEERQQERQQKEQERDSLVELLSQGIFDIEYEPLKVKVPVHHAIIPKDVLKSVFDDSILPKYNKLAEFIGPLTEAQKSALEKIMEKIKPQKEYIEELLREELKLESLKEWRGFIKEVWGKIWMEKGSDKKWGALHYTIKRWLEQRWGFFWVSIAYPARHIHTFPIVHSRLLDDGGGGRSDGKKVQRLKDLIKRETLPEQFLLRQPPRPVLVEDVEFRDRFQGNILLYAIFQVVMPYQPVFVYKEKFYQMIESALGSAFIDYARQVRWVDFVNKVKKGPGSGIYLKALSSINVRTGKSLTGRKVNLGGKGIVEAIGIELVDVWVHDYESTEIDETQKALKAAELARLTGEKNVIEKKKEGEALFEFAKKQAEAVKIVGMQEAAVLKAKAEAGVAVAVAEQMVKGREALKGTNVTTIAESGTQANLLISAGGSKP